MKVKKIVPYLQWSCFIRIIQYKIPEGWNDYVQDDIKVLDIVCQPDKIPKHILKCHIDNIYVKNSYMCIELERSL